jgi:hypothetical protein
MSLRCSECSWTACIQCLLPPGLLARWSTVCFLEWYTTCLSEVSNGYLSFLAEFSGQHCKQPLFIAKPSVEVLVSDRESYTSPAPLLPNDDDDDDNNNAATPCTLPSLSTPRAQQLPVEHRLRQGACPSTVQTRFSGRNINNSRGCNSVSTEVHGSSYTKRTDPKNLQGYKSCGRVLCLEAERKR